MNFKRQQIELLFCLIFEGKIMKITILTLVLTLVFGIVGQSNAQTNQQFKLLVNRQKTVTKDKVTVKFISVVEDSRCPESTNCVWAGNAKIRIKVSKSKGASKTFELNTNLKPQTVMFEGYEIKLVNLNPKPATNIRINRNGYTATFVVSKLAN